MVSEQTGPIADLPVEEEYKKNPWIHREDIGKLRQWIETQPHLPSKHITDLDLILVYHFCEGSAEVSKQMLDLHFTLRTQLTAIFKNRQFDDSIHKALHVFTPAMLSGRARDGSQVVYIRIRDPDPKNLILGDVLRAMTMMSDLNLYEYGTSPGMHIVFDAAGLMLGHLTCIDFVALQQTFQFITKGFLVKVKGLHFINAPTFIDKVLALLKPMMPGTMLDVTHVHTPGSRTIEDFIAAEVLLREDQYDLVKDLVLAKISNNQEFFLKMEKKRVDERLRPNCEKSCDSFGGVEGSFKKLDID